MRPITYPGCYFAAWARDDCSGTMDPAHIIRRQDIRKEWNLANPRIPTAWIPATALTGTDLDELIADRRNIRPSCRHHHRRADDGRIPYQVPASAYDFAEEFGLSHYLPVREEVEARR